MNEVIRMKPRNLTCAANSVAARQKIIARAADNIATIDRSIFDLVEGLGDTPIERLLFEALYIEARTSWQHELSLAIAQPCEQIDKAFLDESSSPTALIESQITVEGARVDFLISVRDGKCGSYKSLVVETDGHEFHEHTKEQAIRDRSRDRKFQSAGLSVYRFTGSEIWDDPCRCANQIIRWIFDTMFPPGED